MTNSADTRRGADLAQHARDAMGKPSIVRDETADLPSGTPGRCRYSCPVPRPGTWLLACSIVLAVGCGARTATIDDPPEPVDRPQPRPEICNHLDDDLDGLVAVGALDGGMDASRPDAGPDGGIDRDLFVDEDFRDELGRYVHDEHCGGCDMPCVPGGNVLEATCALIEETPVCAALRCAPGFTPSSTGRCVPAYERLCLACADDGDCGDFESARCAMVGGERRCTIGCELGCPDGYACQMDVCVPSGGSCSCNPGDSFTLACALFDPEGERCPGSAVCIDGVLSECAAPDEVCDEADNDCDGTIDEGYRDARGAYSLDIHHCGECGVDCTLSTVPEGDLVCGGDPFAPTCVLECPDAVDGIMPGDRIDADRDIATGCECTVGSLSDVPGPVLAVGEDLDVNCDGADGIVVSSFYVAPDGDDMGPGSPTRPMRTLDLALSRAAESLDTPAPRPHVFVASGIYTETLHVPDGVLVHGGYRRDFLALDPTGFRVQVRAPVGTMAPGGAAVEIRGAGVRETVLEWIEVRGLDATSPSAATFGIYALDPGPNLILRDMTVRAGVPGDGMPGLDGSAGRSFEMLPADGDLPRGAVETATHACIPGAANTVAGGRGGVNRCGGVDVSGGTGGSPHCPEFATFQPSGDAGRPAGGLSGGSGGRGGQDSHGPIMGVGCPGRPLCCGLADFTVPSDFQGPQPGNPGRAGESGTPGRGCSDAFGRFDGDLWRGAGATGGTAGSPGSGGGGGGGGGGSVIDWFDGMCEFADGLGGGGGGGGSGGCGGTLGAPGTSGAPSVAILMRYTMGRPARVPTLRNVRLNPSDGGDGGDGGAGGAGGRGALGAFGGELALSDRSTPTLAGPFPGGRGGPGGAGGDGGGGGGGCGGASVGVWLLGVGSEPPGVAAWRTDNVFVLGAPGVAGRGGGGAAPGTDGAEGGAVDVVVR